MFYLTTHSTHFIYGYMASDKWLRTILIVIEETRCRHIGYSFRLAARALLYAPSHRQDSTYHGICYTSRGTLAGTRNRSSFTTILYLGGALRMNKRRMASMSPRFRISENRKVADDLKYDFVARKSDTAILYRPLQIKYCT